VIRVTDRVSSPFRRGRSRALTTALVILVWSVAASAVLVVATETAVGPILIKLSRRHGIHLGDALAFVVFTAAAGALTWLLMRRGRPVGLGHDGGRSRRPRP
jgi:hypothetical protein